jgi:hypothetical protein
MRRVGVIASALASLFLLADAAAEILAIPPVLQGAAHIGFPAASGFWQAIGAILLLATVLYMLPRTAFLGAVIVTGYLGGAICSHVRMQEDVLAPTVISLLVAAAVWAGLVLRDARLRDVLAGR